MAQTRFKIIMQGGGRLLILVPKDMRKDEAGAFIGEVQRHIDHGLPIGILFGVDEVLDNRPLNEQMLTTIITRDRSDGRYHTRYVAVHERGHERLLVDARCKADPEKFDIAELPESLDRNVLCYECFPPATEDVTPTAGAI